MYISHKSNVLQHIHETEWQCRRLTKGLFIPEYWAWLDSVTTVTGTPPDTETIIDLSGQTGYTIIECTDEDVQARLNQLDDYVGDGVYNIKYYASKRDAEEIKDINGNSHEPKQYVQSHFVGQDDTRDARLLAEEWKLIRADRTRLLAETDHLALSDQTLSADMKTYRTSLRDLPSEQSSKTKYSDITWPTKP